MTTTACVAAAESDGTPTTGWASVVSCGGLDLWSSVMPQDPVPSGSSRPSSGLDNFDGRQVGEGPEGAFAPEAIDLRTVNAVLCSVPGKRIREWWAEIIRITAAVNKGDVLALCDLAQIVDHAAWRYRAGPQDDDDFWQSPIERALGAALYVAFTDWTVPAGPDAGVWWMQDHAERNIFSWPPKQSDLTVQIAPQQPVGDYRADFVVRILGPDKQALIAVECDGHDFHERTPEQAEHDKRRDRFFTSQGLQVLRFTGREIYRDPMRCAMEVVALAGDPGDYTEAYGVRS